MRTLNVVKTTATIVAAKWGCQPHHVNGWGCDCFIRCNKDGKVNWEKAPTYKLKELIDKKICIRNLKNP